MPRVLKAKTSIHEFNLTDIRNLIAMDLRVDVEKVEVRYVITTVGGDPLDRYVGRPEVTKIEVTVKE